MYIKLTKNIQQCTKFTNVLKVNVKTLKVKNREISMKYFIQRKLTEIFTRIRLKLKFDEYI